MRMFLLWAVVAACTRASNAPDAAVADAAPDASALGLTRIPLTGCGYSYTGDFAIGGTPFRLLVDTGSPALAVAGASCDTCTAAGVAPPLYTPGATAIDLQRTATQAYDAGEMTWTGEIYTDRVAAGNLPPVALAFASITTQSELFYPAMCGAPQGILGLSPATDIPAGATSFPALLAMAGAEDVFAMHDCVGTGDLWLDGYDPTAATADPTWVTMSSGGFAYEVQLDDVAIDGTSAGVPAATYGMAIVDSGGPDLGLPASAYTAVTTMVAAAPAFRARFGDASWFGDPNNCVVLDETRAQLDAELPKLTVSIGSPAISIELPATDSYVQTYTSADQLEYCPGMFSSPSVSDLGNALLRAGIVIFDRARGRLGFAPAPPCNDVALPRSMPGPRTRRRTRMPS